MKIASFNVNGITARLPNLLRWLAETRPDVACLQELKVPHDKLPEAAIREAGYGVIWHGQKSFNGVAILARGADPVEVRRILDPRRRGHIARHGGLRDRKGEHQELAMDQWRSPQKVFAGHPHD